MVDTLLGIGTCLAIGIVAMALLAWRDTRRHRRREELTPVPVRIGRIRDDAAFMVRQFQGVLERGPAERTRWLGPVLAYYRQLETLATEARPSAEQARRLAEEAGQYIQQTRLKGIAVAQQARQLADLAQRLPEGRYPRSEAGSEMNIQADRGGITALRGILSSQPRRMRRDLSALPRYPYPAQPRQLSPAEGVVRRQMRRRRLRRCLVAAALIGLVAALFLLPAGPPLPPGPVDKVTIKLSDWGNGQKAATVSSTDQSKIDPLLACLRRAQATGDHKCGDSETILLHWKTGEQLKLGILAGHNPSYYEFRVYRGSGYTIYRTEREAFLKAMNDLGVPPLHRGAAE